jgi:hypothetical protein
MECREARESIVLYLYGETGEAESLDIERHVDGCPSCRIVQAEERRLLAVLSQRPAAEPTAELLERCRVDLSAALGSAAPAPTRARFRDRARLQPAFAAAFLLVGFLGGGLAVGHGIVPVPFGRTDRGATRATRLEPAAGSSLNSLSVDPFTDRVTVGYDTLSRGQIVGPVADPEIRRMLVATVRDSFNAGLRLDALDALRDHAGESEVREALMRTLRQDRNAGARLKAIDALEAGAAQDAEVRGAILQALLHDGNPGVRVRAIDALAAAPDPATLPVMQRLAREDHDSYVRLRSGDAVEAMFAKEKR